MIARALLLLAVAVVLLVLRWVRQGRLDGGWTIMRCYSPQFERTAHAQ